MTVLDIEKVRQRQDKEEGNVPPQYVIVLHANPAIKNLVIVLAITHILVDHLGMVRSEAVPIVTDALRSGRRVVRPVTKDVGETMMALINACAAAESSSDYKFSLELA